MSWRQHHGGATPAPLDGAQEKDLKFKPGMSGAEQKARAKELRKYAELRGQLRELQREKKREEQRLQQEAAVPSPRAEANKQVALGDDRPVCSFFLVGKCTRGARCKFSHTWPDEDAGPEGGTAAADMPSMAALDVVDQLSADLWLQVLGSLGVASVCSVACCCSALAAVAATPALWMRLHAKTFGEEAADEAHRAGGADALSGARLACCRSEAALGSWARVVHETPAELPVAQASAVALVDKLGVSTSLEGRMLRLWEARSGRRLSCRSLKAPPLALHAAAIGARPSAYDSAGRRPVAVVGDASGALHVLELEEELEGPAQRRPFTPRVTTASGPMMPWALGWRIAMCAALVWKPLGGRGGGRSGRGAGGGAGDGANDAGGEDDTDWHQDHDDDDDADDADEEDDEGNEEEEDDDEPSQEAGTTEGRAADDDLQSATIGVVSAYRDGALVLSRFAPDVTTAARCEWYGSLALADDGSLRYARTALGAPPATDAPVDEWRGGLARLWNEEGCLPLVSLAAGGNGGGGGGGRGGSGGEPTAFYAAWGGMACAIDTERGIARWASGRVAGDVEDIMQLGEAAGAVAGGMGGVVELEGGAERRTDTSMPHGGMGAQLASYSDGWHLLAVACRQTVTLWDDRLPPGRPVGRVQSEPTPPAAAGARHDGGCVYLDEGGGPWSGHLLHLPPGSGATIQIYDVRGLGGRGARPRVHCGVLRSAPPLVARIALTRRGHGLGGSFAVDPAAGALVAVGSGTGKMACSYRWSIARYDDGRAGGVVEDEQAEDEAVLEMSKAAAKERAAAKKKHRVVTKGGGYKAKKGGTSRTG